MYYTSDASLESEHYLPWGRSQAAFADLQIGCLHGCPTSANFPSEELWCCRSSCDSFGKLCRLQKRQRAVQLVAKRPGKLQQGWDTLARCQLSCPLVPHIYCGRLQTSLALSIESPLNSRVWLETRQLDCSFLFSFKATCWPFWSSAWKACWKLCMAAVLKKRGPLLDPDFLGSATQKSATQNWPVSLWSKCLGLPTTIFGQSWWLRGQVWVQHYKEAACHQVAMEKILHEAGVDLVFTGNSSFWLTCCKALSIRGTPRRFCGPPSMRSTNN